MSITGIALVPASPMLIPGMTGQTPPPDEVRRPALLAIGEMLNAQPEIVIVIAEGPRDEVFEDHTSLHLHRLGGMRDDPSNARSLPIALAIGAALLQDAGWSGPMECHSVGTNASTFAKRIASDPRNVGLLLLANGSACSSVAAPGSLHPEAHHFNTDFLEFLRSPSEPQPSRLGQVACADQLSDAFGPLQVYGSVTSDLAVASNLTVRIRYADEFRGVFLVCASALP